MAASKVVFLIARSLNTVSNANEIVIQVTNTGHSETTLYKGTHVGIFSIDIDHGIMTEDRESAGVVQNNEMPEVELSSTNLTTEQVLELKKLIWEF